MKKNTQCYKIYFPTVDWDCKISGKNITDTSKGRIHQEIKSMV